MVSGRFTLAFVVLLALSDAASATLSADPGEAEPAVTGSIAETPPLQVEIGAASSSEIAIEKDESAPPAQTPEDVKRQSTAK